MLSWRKKITNVSGSKVWNNNNFVFLLLAFLLPLIVRAIPEVLMGSYVTGFDTMGHYVPTTLLWMNGYLSPLELFANAPLFYSIVISLVSAGVTPIMVLKIIIRLIVIVFCLSIFISVFPGRVISSVDREHFFRDTPPADACVLFPQDHVYLHP